MDQPQPSDERPGDRRSPPHIPQRPLETVDDAIAGLRQRLREEEALASAAEPVEPRPRRGKLFRIIELVISLAVAGVIAAASIAILLGDPTGRAVREWLSDHRPDTISVSVPGGGPPVSPTAVERGQPLATPAAPQLILDEVFANNRLGWPHDPQGTAWVEPEGYHLMAREPSRFVAIGAPVQPLRDVEVRARFRKVGGPPGGGYGIIVRDRGGLGPRDGKNQSGRYYVFEAGDRGEVGIWQRAEDSWVDLLPWTGSGLVQPGGAVNELTVRAIGSQFTFLVNGVTVRVLEDSALGEGNIGLFVGGDFNEVLLERFAVFALS